MRPKLNWEGYADAARTFELLSIPIGVELLRLIASNPRGMTQQQVIEASQYGEEMVKDWLSDLIKEGFLVTEIILTSPGNYFSKVEYYKANWKTIKQINRAISKLP